MASLIQAGHSLFGTTSAGGAYGYGTVFSLTPPATPSGTWAEQIIYSFTGGSDGATPLASLITDKTGTLYGTTSAGGVAFYNAGHGTVFALKPPSVPNGAWTETVLHAFAAAADGRVPYARVTRGKGGVLYGTTLSNDTESAGTVFSLTPPVNSGDPWGETILSSFALHVGNNLEGYLVIGKTGVLLGTVRGNDTFQLPRNCGGVFAVVPPSSPGGAWTTRIIESFPVSVTGICSEGSGLDGGLVRDASGAL
ncbi:MAG: choice-of-anchor tandem repeat GloVer-containing protein, partial [Terriglobales bacterium]